LELDAVAATGHRPVRYNLDSFSTTEMPSTCVRIVGRLVIFVGVLVTVAPALLIAQTADPRADFLTALGQFSLALDGTYGDEGRRLSAALDAMTEALSRWDASIQSRERAMAADITRADPPLAARMHVAVAGLYLDRLREDDALKELAAARASDPARPEAPLFQWLIHSQITRDTRAATDALKAAHAINPADPVRTYLLARHLLELGQREAGLDLLEQVRAPVSDAASRTAPFIRVDLVRETPGIEPFFPPTAYAEGFASMQKGDLPQALTQLREALRADPLMTLNAADTDPVARATAAFRDGLVDDARTQLDMAVSQLPDRAEAHRVRGMINRADGGTTRAVSELRTAIRLDPSDERARVALANLFLENDVLDEAEQTLDDTIRALPSSGRAHYLRGLTYQRQGRRVDAIRELREALAYKPLLGANTIHRMIGTLQQEQQDLEAAAASFAARVDLVPNDHDAHRDLGRVYFTQGEDVQARAEFEIALLVDPVDADALTALGQLHLREGRPGDAADVSRRALEIDAGHREARYVYATSLIRLGKADEGKAEMQVFQRLQAEDSEARARTFELGRLRREASVARTAGDHTTAVTLLQRALVLDPRAAASHLDLGVALLDAGQVTAAVERLKTAVALNAPLDVHRYLASAYAAIGQKDASAREQSTYERLRREAISRTGRAR
jgi:tetratricopeptide (TPR) repeat protein